MYYEISVRTTTETPTAVVSQATTWEEFHGLWRSLLDEVYRLPSKRWRNPASATT